MATEGEAASNPNLPLRILILDGGEPGAGAYSQLLVLQELLHRLQWNLKEPLAPTQLCKWFDVISGSGMGGLFAILATIFQMTIEEMRGVTKALNKGLFSGPHWKHPDCNKEENLTTFKSILETALADHVVDLNSALCQTRPDMNCRGFLCAAYPQLLRQPQVFSTHQSQQRPINCTVLQALVLSLSDSHHFPAVVLEDSLFIGATHPWVNPAQATILHLARSFHTLPSIASILSIGFSTGQVLPIDPEAEADLWQSRCPERLFCRLSIPLNGIPPDIGHITAATRVHLSEPRFSDIVLKSVVRSLHARSDVINLQNLISFCDRDDYGIPESLPALIKNLEELPNKIAHQNALNALPYAQAASWDPSLGCLPETRIEILHDLRKWFDNPSGNMIMWLLGPAGSGKSTIAHSVAEYAHSKGILGSTFFTKMRRSKDATSFIMPQPPSPYNFVGTLLHDLAAKYPRFQHAIASQIASTPALASDPRRQFIEALVPHAHLLSSEAFKPILCICDAFDELRQLDQESSPFSSNQLLELLKNDVMKLPNTFRFLFTSRAPPTTMWSCKPPHMDMTHLDLGSNYNKQDVGLIAQKKLQNLASSHGLGGWPEEKDVQEFITKADGLPLWVELMIKFLEQSHSPKSDLRKILNADSTSNGTEWTAHMRNSYKLILEACMDHQLISASHNYVEKFLGILLAVGHPLSISGYMQLYPESSGDGFAEALPKIAKHLGPVLSGAEQNSKIPLDFIHISFRDYIKSQENFLHELPHSHQSLAVQCLRILNTSLTNETPGADWLDGSDLKGIPEISQSSIDEGLLYSSAFWVEHVENALEVDGHSDEMAKELNKFVTSKLIIWAQVHVHYGPYKSALRVLERWKVRPAILCHQNCAETWQSSRRRIWDSMEGEVAIYDPWKAKTFKHLGELLRRSSRWEEARQASEDGVHMLQKLAQKHPKSFSADLASSLHSLSIELGNLDHREEALSAIQQAVDLRKQLAQEQPNVFNADLASSLHSLCVALVNLNHREEALSAIKTAVDLRKQLAQKQPDEFNSELASSLQCLSVALGNLNHRDEALIAIKQAVDLQKHLGREQPNADLASSLHSLSVKLGDVGQQKEALDAIKEAVDLRRQLAQEQPHVFSSQLASSLHNLSVCLRRLGHRKDALTAIREAVGLQKQLAQEQPHVYNEELAASLQALSNDLGNLDYREESLSAIQQAVNLWKQLAQQRPHVFTAELAGSLHSLSVALGYLNHREEALSAIEQAVNLRKQLAQKHPHVFNAALASSLTNLSADLGSLDRQHEALSAIEEAVGLWKQLAQERPRVFNADLASSLLNLSIYLGNCDRQEEALSAIEQAVDLRKQLAKEQPLVFNADLAASLHSLSVALSHLNRQYDALEAVQQAIDLWKQLAKELPNVFNAGLADSFHNLSIYLANLDRQQEAVNAIEQAVYLRRQLAKERPHVYNAELASSLRNLYSYLDTLGRQNEALTAIQQVVALRKQLAKEQPHAFTAHLASSLRSLSICLGKLNHQDEASRTMKQARALWDQATQK